MDHVTEEVLVARFIMLGVVSQSDGKPFLAVEGRSDRKAYQRALSTVYNILIGEGKGETVAAVRSLREDGARIVGFVDADFDHILEVDHGEGVVITVHHDLELGLLMSGAFERFLESYATGSKLGRFFEDKNAEDRIVDVSRYVDRARSQLLKAVAPIGFLRLVSRREGLNLSFKGLKFKGMLRVKDLTLDRGKLVKRVLALTRKGGNTCAVDESDLLKRLAEAESEGHDLAQVCQGHDLTRVVAIALRNTWGSNKTDADVLERALRLAFDVEEFRASAEYRELVKLASG